MKKWRSDSEDGTRGLFYFFFHYELQYTNRNTMTALSTMRNSYTNNCKNIPCILESLRCVFFFKIDYYPLVPDWGDHIILNQLIDLRRQFA